MKIKYFYYELKSSFGHAPTVLSSIELIGTEKEKKDKGTYFSCFSNLTETLDMCEDVLVALDKVASKKVELDSVGLNDDMLTVFFDFVQIDILIDDSLIDQPEGRFTHDQIRKAVEGKIKFLNMEKQVGVELEVDIG